MIPSEALGKIKTIFLDQGKKAQGERDKDKG
jgi:hypothetical protein